MPRPLRSAAAAALAALVLLAAGCAAGGSGSAGEAAVRADLGFTATTVGGARFAGTQLVGKPVVLWFWAPWCMTCRAQTPLVNDVAERYDGRARVLAVGGMADPAAIRNYAANISDAATVLVDPGGSVWRNFGITAQSTFVVLDARGRIVARGHVDPAEQVADLVG